jgi:hypothetical protein
VQYTLRRVESHSLRPTRIFSLASRPLLMASDTVSLVVSWWLLVFRPPRGGECVGEIYCAQTKFRSVCRSRNQTLEASEWKQRREGPGTYAPFSEHTLVPVLSSSSRTSTCASARSHTWAHIRQLTCVVLLANGEQTKSYQFLREALSPGLS